MKELYNMTIREMIEAMDAADQWDEVMDIAEYLCKWFAIDPKDEDGEWKNGDELFAEIKETHEIIEDIEGNGGFNNFNNWNIDEISVWVMSSYGCSERVAENVAYKI